MVARKVTRIPKARRPAPAPKQWPEPLSITLPLPPSLNNAYNDAIYYDKTSKKMRVRRVPSSDLLAFQRDAPIYLMQQRIPRGSWSDVEAVGYISRVYVPTAASDLDNRNKHWQDVVAAWLGFNDNRIQECHGNYRRIDPENPRVEVQLFPVRKVKKGEL